MTRVLIVNGSVQESSRSRQILRAFRRGWDLDFRVTAADGFEALRDHPFDVIVSDLHLDGTSGADLLAGARKNCPAAVRLLVCPREDHADLLQTMGPAHHYLPAGYDPEQFREFVGRAMLLADRLTRPGLRQMVAAVESLPSLPAIYLDLLDELNSKDASIDRVAKLIAGDLGMSAKILQLINSPFFGLVMHVRDVRHAAALLGLNALKPLVLAAGVFRQLDTSRVSPSQVQSLLDHSLAVGSLAHRIAQAEDLDATQVDHALLAGVMHDIGKLVLADRLGRDYQLVCEAASRVDLPVQHAEEDQFETSHAEVGGYLLALWGVAQPLIEAVAYHHDPSALPNPQFTPLAAVHVADALLREVDQGLPGEIEAPVASSKLDTRLVAELGLQDRLATYRQWAAGPLAHVAG
jgi:putative nucleotidyltransferase with HDIG domain